MKCKKNQTTFVLIASGWTRKRSVNEEDLLTKMNRDGLEYEKNTIIHISRSSVNSDVQITGNIRTISLKSYSSLKFLYYLLNIYSIPKLLETKKIHPDAIIISESAMILGCLWHKYKRKVRILYSLTNLPKDLAKTRKFTQLRMVYFKLFDFIVRYSVDYVVVINEATSKYATSIGVPVEKIKIVAPNVIATNKVYIASARKGVIRERYNIPDNKKLILSVGRLEKEKDFDRLIRYFSTLPTEFILIICGTGSLKDDLLNLVEELGIDERVIFAGFVSRQEIWSFYLDADLFILLSKSEALGLVVWEAMYMKCPVITSSAQGFIESIGEGNVRGYILEDHASNDDFYKLVCKSLETTENNSNVISRAYEYVEGKIDNIPTMNAILDSNYYK